MDAENWAAFSSTRAPSTHADGPSAVYVLTLLGGGVFFFCVRERGQGNGWLAGGEPSGSMKMSVENKKRVTCFPVFSRYHT